MTASTVPASRSSSISDRSAAPRGTIRSVRSLGSALYRTQTVWIRNSQLLEELAELVRQTGPHVLAETGVGPITAARLLGEIAGIERC
jgi:transposase